MRRAVDPDPVADVLIVIGRASRTSRSARSCMKWKAHPASRAPTNHDGTSLVSASNATQVQISPPPSSFFPCAGVFLLSPNERPNLIALYALAGKVLENAVLILRASRPEVSQQFHNRRPVNARHAGNRPQRISLQQVPQIPDCDLRSLSLFVDSG